MSENYSQNVIALAIPLFYLCVENDVWSQTQCQTQMYTNKIKASKKANLGENAIKLALF